MPTLTKAIVTIEPNMDAQDMSHTANVIEEAVKELRTHLHTNGFPAAIVRINSDLEHDI
jgi:hypothetical protein